MTDTPARLIDQLDLPDDLRTLDAESLRRVADEVREEIITTISENGGHLGASLGVVELTIALHAELNTPAGRDHLGRGASVVRPQAAHRPARLLRLHPHLRRTVRVPVPRREPVRRLRHGAQQQLGERRRGHGGRRASGQGGGRHRRRGPDRRHGLRGPQPRRAPGHPGAGDPERQHHVHREERRRHERLPLPPAHRPDALSLPARHGAAAAEAARRGRPHGRRGRAAEGQHQGGPGAGDALRGPGLHVRGRHRRPRHRGAAGEHQALAGGRRPGAAALPDGQGQGLCARRAGSRAAITARRGSRWRRARTSTPKGPPPSPGPSARRWSSWRAATSAWWASPRPWPRGPGLDLLREALPDRFFDVGIAEAHAVASPPVWPSPASGRSWPSTRPSCSGPTTRSSTTSACRVCPVVFAVDRAGLVGEDGPTHHGAFDLSFLRIIPGLTVFVPKDEAELQRMLATALTLDGPSVIRYPRSAGIGVPLERPIKPLEGPWVEVVAEGVRRPAADGRAGHPVGRVRGRSCLPPKGIEATVAGVSRVHPLDGDAIRAAGRAASGRGHRGGQRAGGRLRLGHPRVHVGGGAVPPDCRGSACPMPSCARARSSCCAATSV